MFAACTRPGDYPITSNCVWTEENTDTLDLSTISDRRHLRFDAVVAEDVAIRWADHHVGNRPEWDEQCARCRETLFAGVAKQHGVDVAIVRQYSRERDVVVDAAVILSFGALYAVAAYILAGWIRRRFAPGEPGFWVMTLTMAVGVSLVGVLAGGLWSMIVEGIRMNSGHLSYRTNRIPFRRNWELLLVCGFGVFALASLVRSRRSLRVSEKPANE
jgi:hypothetical protein